MIQVSGCKLCAFVYNIRVVLFSYHVVFCSIQGSVEWIWSSRAMYLLHRVSSFWFSRTCMLPINALTPLTKLSRTTKWQGVLFPCRFAQLPLYGFASVDVDGLPNCHLRPPLQCLIILQISSIWQNLLSKKSPRNPWVPFVGYCSRDHSQIFYSQHHQHQLSFISISMLPYMVRVFLYISF